MNNRKQSNPLLNFGFIRHFDTAKIYENEEYVAKGLKRSW